MAARIEGVERHDPVGLRKGTGGRLPVAGLPVVDVVGVLSLLVVADQRRPVRERLLRRRDRGQDVVLDVDQLQRVLGDVADSATTAATSCPWNRTLSVASTAWVSPERVGIQARL